MFYTPYINERSSSQWGSIDEFHHQIRLKLSLNFPAASQSGVMEDELLSMFSCERSRAIVEGSIRGHQSKQRGSPEWPVWAGNLKFTARVCRVAKCTSTMSLSPMQRQDGSVHDLTLDACTCIRPELHMYILLDFITN